MLQRLIWLLLLLPVSNVFGAEKPDNLIPVFVGNQCEKDPVGRQIALNVEEFVRKSFSMDLAPNYAESLVTIHMLCRTADADTQGVSATYALLITAMNTSGFYDYKLDVSIATCGVSRVAECAEQIVANADSAIIELKRRIRDGTFTPQ